MNAVVHDRSLEAQARGLALHRELSLAPVWIDADRVRMVQVLDNLLGNAIKFTDSGGKIHVTLRADSGHAVFCIRDTGVGIRPEMIERLFVPFQQESQSLARSAGGLGLGLALVKGLVELHDGVIEVRSEGPDTGAEFQIHLALAATPCGGLGSAVPESASRRILVVEDNRDAGHSLRDLLELHGHRVEVVESGVEALAVLANHGADVVLCDLGLPCMSGFDVARAIRSDQALHEIHLVALTGYGQPEDRRKTAEAGFDDHLVKPVDINQLNEALRRT
ncbi:MAG: ATP-binding protein [Polyangiaceae bacterium]